MSQGFTCSRRQFLLASAGSVAVAACGAGNNAPSPTGDVVVGTVQSLQVGQVSVASDSSCAVLRDSAGLYALSLTCTHQGCNLAQQGTVSAQGMTCFCHGSQFGPNGEVLAGPAFAPLPHFALTVDTSSNIVVHLGQLVAASQRTPV
jgi:Rieske Fe-S protein